MRSPKNIFSVLLLFAACAASAERFDNLMSNGYSLALTSEVGNGNLWMYLQKEHNMYICLNLPGVNRMEECRPVAATGRISYTELLRDGAKLIAHNKVGNGNEWLTFLKGSQSVSCLAMPGIYTIECK
jgi:hypothetical protein